MSKTYLNPNDQAPDDESTSGAQPTPGAPQSLGRRRLLKMLTVAGGAIAAGTLLPSEWVEPVMKVGVLPAHALTTPPYSPTPTPRREPPLETNPEQANIAADPTSSTSVEIRWTDFSNEEIGYEIERSPDVSPRQYEKVDDVSSDRTAKGGSLCYYDSGLTPDTTYWYRVRAKHVGGTFSDHSGEVSVTTQP